MLDVCSRSPLRRRWGFAAVVAAALSVGGEARAAAPPKATVAIDIAAEGVPAWQLDAFRQALSEELATDKRLQPVDTTVADIVLGGALAPGQWRYQIRMTWPLAAPPLRGSIALDGGGRRALMDALAGALEPVLRAGGLLDQRAHPIVEEEAAELPAPGGGAAALAAVGLALLAAWLLLPFGFGALLGVKLGGLRALRRSLMCCAALAVAALALVAAPGQLPAASWAILIGGGLAWGWFLAALMPHALPPLQGFGRVEYGDLLRLIGSWTLLVVQRAARTALLLAPAAGLVWLAWALLDLPALIAVGVVAPVLGLLGRLWVRSWVEVLAARLDDDLIGDNLGENDPWHQAVRGYFMGYARRVGWPDADHLLDGIRFLPGGGEDVHLYGGGLTHTRVIIGRQLLEFALAPYGRPHDYAAPRVSKLHWTEWNAGLVVPVEVGATLATKEQRQPRELAMAGDESEIVPLGEPPTLVGYVEPYKLDKRNAHRPWEDPLWLDWDPGAEYDGTDASDKDFLFGLLVWQLGRIQRHEDRSATLALATRRWLDGKPGLARVAGRIGGGLRLLFARHPAAIGDAYAALNFARHHLFQYLAWQIWRRDDLLSARAFAPEMARDSRAILAVLEAENVREPRTAGATPRRRLIWASGFVSEALRSRGARVWRRAVVAAVLVGALVGGGLAVKQAVDYHPTWVQRMDEQRARLQPSADEMQERQTDGKED